jgi:hypothetical protein
MTNITRRSEPRSSRGTRPLRPFWIKSVNGASKAKKQNRINPLTSAYNTNKATRLKAIQPNPRSNDTGEPGRICYADVLCKGRERLTLSRVLVGKISKSDPNGIRTRVTAVKGRCPRPLDDRVEKAGQYQKSPDSPQGKFPRDCDRNSRQQSKIDNQRRRARSCAAVSTQHHARVLHERFAQTGIAQEIGHCSLQLRR